MRGDPGRAASSVDFEPADVDLVEHRRPWLPDADQRRRVDDRIDAVRRTPVTARRSRMSPSKSCPAGPAAVAAARKHHGLVPMPYDGTHDRARPDSRCRR